MLPWSNRNALKSLKQPKNNTLTSPTPLFKFIRHWSFRSRYSTRFSILYLFTTIAHPGSGEHFFADVAQLVEQLIRNQQVTGSSPVVGFLICELAELMIAEFSDCAVRMSVAGVVPVAAVVVGTR